MLSIKIGTSFIPVDPSISLPLVLRSPLFPTSDSKIPGSYIFNTRFPASDVLRKEFVQAHRPGKHGRATAELDYIIQNGVFRYKGKCVVTQADKNNYEIAFRVGNGDLAAKLSKLSLKDLDLGGDRQIAEVYSSACIFEPFEINTSDPDFFQVSITAPDQIVTDISSCLSNFGRTFTANSNTAIKQVIKFSADILLGTVRVVVKKNGIEILNESVNGTERKAVFTTNLTPVSGDVYTVELFGESEPSNEGQSIIINVYQCTVEYYSVSIMTTSVSETQDTSDFVVFPVFNNRLLENFPDDAFELDNLSLKTLYNSYFPVQNYWLDDEFPMLLQGYNEDGYFLATNIFTPFVYCSKILSEIIEEAGYTLVNNPFKDISGSSNKFYGAVLFNAFGENTYTTSFTQLVPAKATFNLIDHIPDIKQSDFISYISRITGYYPIIDNDLLTVTFVSIKDRNIESADNPCEQFTSVILDNPIVTVEPEYNGITFELKAASVDSYLSERIKEIPEKFVYKGSEDNLSALPTGGNKVNDMYLVTHDNSFYVWQYNPDIYALAWCFYTRNWPLVYSEGEEPFLNITSEISPILTTYIKDELLGAPEDRYWTLPVTYQAGILEGFPDSFGGETGLQMLVYRGKVLDSLSAEYPLGTSNTADYSNDLFVNLNAEAIFNERYKNFLQWIAYSTKPVRLQAIISPADLKALDITKIQRTERFSFLIKEIRTNITIDGISKAEMDVYIC